MSAKEVKAFGTEAAEAALQQMGIQRRKPTPHDVEIEILFCGVCHSDLHTARNEWHSTTYPCVPGHEIVGKVVSVGEHVSKFRIGDLAGVTLALEAYRFSLDGQDAPVLDGITGDQRVFYGWAQVWRAADRDDAMRQMLATDPHSPPQYRVIGPVRNIDAWYDAFDVEPGDESYLAPEDRVRLW